MRPIRVLPRIDLCDAGAAANPALVRSRPNSGSISWIVPWQAPMGRTPVVVRGQATVRDQSWRGYVLSAIQVFASRCWMRHLVSCGPVGHNYRTRQIGGPN